MVRELIQQSLDYIEENLKAELPVGELAERAGFSLYHFCRIFQAQTGLPVKQYIRKRRLLHALWEASQGERLVEVALAYGFDTHAGFFKAFQREFGCAPSLYMKKHPVKPPHRVNLLQGGISMIPKKKLRQVLAAWGMENETVEDMYWPGTGARADNVWQVGTRCVLKTGENLPGLQTSIHVARALKAKGISAAPPIQTLTGEDYLLEQGRWFCLMELLPGERLKSGKLFSADNSAAAGLGRMIGQLHQALLQCGDALDVDHVNLFDAVKTWALPRTKELGLLPAGFEEWYSAFLEDLPELPEQVIHRDLHPGNLILQDGGCTGFVDFDHSEWNIRLFDPCYFCTGVLSEQLELTMEGDRWFHMLAGVLNGYHDICRLTADERAAVPWVIFSIELLCIAFFAGKDALSEQAAANRHMFSWLWENRKKLALT